MTPAEFDVRLQELLDHRVDPLDDAACIAFLAEHPERLDGLAMLRERLAELSAVARPAAPPRRVRPTMVSVLAAVAAAAALVVAWLAQPADRDVVPRSLGRVIAATSTVVPLHPDGVAGGRARSVLLERSDARLEVFSRW